MTDNPTVAAVYARANIALPDKYSFAKLAPGDFNNLLAHARITDPAEKAAAEAAFRSDGRLTDPPDPILKQSEVAAMIATAADPVQAAVAALQAQVDEHQEQSAAALAAAVESLQTAIEAIQADIGKAIAAAVAPLQQAIAALQARAPVTKKASDAS